MYPSSCGDAHRTRCHSQPYTARSSRRMRPHHPADRHPSRSPRHTAVSPPQKVLLKAHSDGRGCGSASQQHCMQTVHPSHGILRSASTFYPSNRHLPSAPGFPDESGGCGLNHLIFFLKILPSMAELPLRCNKAPRYR